MPLVSSEIEVGLLKVTLLTRAGKDDASKLISRITFGNRVVFRFDADNYQRKTLVKLIEVAGQNFALTLQDQHLIDVYDIAAMTAWQMVGTQEGRPVFEGRDDMDAVQQRLRIGHEQKLVPTFTKNEFHLVQWMAKKKGEEARRADEEAREASRREREQEQAARNEQRRQEVSRILGRGIIRGFSADGAPLSGVPIVGE
jgi:hypothetical protein